MHIFQQGHTTRLIIVSVLLLSLFSFFMGSSGTASAASAAATHSLQLSQGTSSTHVALPSASKHASLRSSASGGGCNYNQFISACINLLGDNSVFPSAIVHKNACDVDVVLYDNGYYVDDYYYSGCFPAGSSFGGPSYVQGASGHFYQSYAVANSNGVGQFSPLQWA